jgi:hypothetical protein
MKTNLLRPAQTVIMALLAACLLIAFISAPGTFDDYAFIEWAKLLNAPGPFAGYRLLGQKVDLDYPPIGVSLMWLSLRLGHAAGWSDLLSFKAPLAMLSCAGALIAGVRGHAPLDALILLLIVTPFGLILGYTDVTYLPFLLIAFYAAESGDFAVAGAALAFAAFIKWQAILLAPIFLIAAVSHTRSVRDFCIVALPTIILVVAVLAAFDPATVCHVLLTATSENYFGGQGVNAAWLLSWVFEVLHVGGLDVQPNGAIAILFTPSPVAAVNVAATALRVVFYVLFVASLGIYIAGRKTRDALLASALACALAQFTWNTGVHENHLFVSLIAAFAAWQARVLDHFTFAAIAVIATLNVMLFYGFGDGFNFVDLGGIDATVCLAAAELLVYGMVLKLQLDTCLGPDGGTS